MKHSKKYVIHKKTKLILLIQIIILIMADYSLTCNNQDVKPLISNEDKDYILSLKVTWYLWKGGIKKDNRCLKTTGGYICGHYENRTRYLHDIIMRRVCDKPSDKHSVDHINRNKLDNRRENLRWATQSEQNKNTDKRARKYSAQPLPEGLTQQMLPKYIVYYHECYNKEKQLFREFFKIERHPKTTKPIIGSKSRKFIWKEKLKMIQERLQNLENDIIEPPSVLPTYYRINTVRKAPHMVYERRTDSKRYGLTMKLKEGAAIENELERFNLNLYEKYPEQLT